MELCRDEAIKVMSRHRHPDVSNVVQQVVGKVFQELAVLLQIRSGSIESDKTHSVHYDNDKMTMRRVTKDARGPNERKRQGTISALIQEATALLGLCAGALPL